MKSYPHHWSYYMSLEADLLEASRFVEICPENFRTHSVQFTRMLLAAGSEVDVMSKLLCLQLDPGANPRNIDQYRETIDRGRPALRGLVIGVQWLPVRVTPWKSWGETPPRNPEWWRA